MTTTFETALTSPKADGTRDTGTDPVVDIVIPVYNEERTLTASVRRLHAYLGIHFPFAFRITIADNASTDHTWAIAQALAEDLRGVCAERIEEKGRGRALHDVWSRSTAAVLCYMDVDLSTDLAALLPLVAPLLSGHSDIAIGTRLAGSSRVVRGPKREIISRCYNLLLRATLSAGFSDAQCGFKAIRADRARELLPLVRDNEWFFDTELLVLAEHAGMRIHEVPVDWVDDPDSRVDIVRTAIADLQGIARLTGDLARGRLGRVSPGLARESGGSPIAQQLLRFCGIGALSTIAYLLLYLALRTDLSATTSNAIALFVTAIANTAANRAFTFGMRGKPGRLRHQTRGLAAFVAGLALSTGALGLLHALLPTAGRLVELCVLVVANLASTLLRFVLFRNWVFGRPAARTTPSASLYESSFSPSAKELS